MFWKARKGTPTPPEAAPRGLSLAFRLTAWYSSACFLLVAIATALLYFGLAANLKRLSEQLLADEVDVCRMLVRQHPGNPYALREEAEIDSAIRRYERFYVRVLDEQGHALATTPGMDTELSSAGIARASARRGGGFFWLQSPGGVPYRALVARIPGNSNHVFTLQIAMDLRQEIEVLSRHRTWVWIVLAMAMILCPWIGSVIARRGTEPLRELAGTARHIGSSTLNERIRMEGYPTEVATLAETFNGMLQRLEESFARLTRFSADIAHELRTPVSNLCVQAEVALARTRTPEEYRDVLVSCLEESMRLSELIESLLFLARAESPGDHLRRSRQDISALLTDVRDYYDAAATEAGVQLLVSDCGNLAGEVDAMLLRRALGNLVTNALAHTQSGGAIRLSATQERDTLRIEVTDNGSGIAAADLLKVFDRFYRADPARARKSGGSGLGLSIARQIASLHGGDMQIASELGKGTTVSVILPRRR
jgi:two-component system heavy metal sensor histidine kinase CusS